MSGTAQNVDDLLLRKSFFTNHLSLIPYTVCLWSLGCMVGLISPFCSCKKIGQIDNFHFPFS